MADLINGESEAEIRAGYLLYNEKLTGRVREVQNVLKNTLAAIGAGVDYPEEDVEEESREEVRAALQKAKNGIGVLLAGYGTGRRAKTGVTVAICGKPNTGKSSILNRLLGYDKAIVSATAGTTRDAVEGEIELEGVRFRFYDTAGVRESGDEIENAGIALAEKLIKSADLRVFVSAKGAPFTQEDAQALELAKCGAYIKVLNKADLKGDETETDADVTVSRRDGRRLCRTETAAGIARGWRAHGRKRVSGGGTALSGAVAGERGVKIRVGGYRLRAAGFAFRYRAGSMGNARRNYGRNRFGRDYIRNFFQVLRRQIINARGKTAHTFVALSAVLGSSVLFVRSLRPYSRFAVCSFLPCVCAADKLRNTVLSLRFWLGVIYCL